jgi:Sulfatase
MMVRSKTIWLALLALTVGVMTASTPAATQQQQAKPNILFIMGDDIGWMQPSIYHRGLMVGETPNIDRIGNEGAIFMDYVAMQSCTSGRNAFFTGMRRPAPGRQTRRSDCHRSTRAPARTPRQRQSRRICSRSTTKPPSGAGFAPPQRD